jgi:hypothetical protein
MAAPQSHPDYRGAIRHLLLERGVLPEGSPGAEAKAELLVDIIVDIAEVQWRTEREARAAERLSLRGDVVSARREREEERRRRVAAEREARVARGERDALEARVARYEFGQKFHHRRAVEMDGSVADTRRESRFAKRGATDLRRTLRRVRFAACGVTVVAATAAVWAVRLSSAETITKQLSVAGIALLGLASIGWFAFGRSALSSLEKWLFRAFGVIGFVLEYLSWRRK